LYIFIKIVLLFVRYITF